MGTFHESKLYNYSSPKSALHYHLALNILCVMKTIVREPRICDIGVK